MTNVRAVLFDLDDTLYPERRFLLSGCRQVATAIGAVRGIPAADVFVFMQRWIRRHGRSRLFQAVCREFLLPRDWAEDMVQILRRHQPDIRLPHASVETLRRLRDAGLRTAVVTNGTPAIQRGKVAALGLAPLVDAVIYAEEHAPGGKPHAAVYARTLLRLQVPAASAVFVGDHPVKDIAGAAAAGMTTIWLTRRPLSADVPADLVVDDVAAVPEAVFSFDQRVHAHAS